MPLLSFVTDTVLFGNSLLRWAVALLLGVAVYFALGFVRNALKARVRRRGKGRGFRPDDLLLTLLAETRSWALLLAGAYVVTLVLETTPAAALQLHRLFVIVLFIQVAIWGNGTITYLADLYREREDLDGSRRTSWAALTFAGRVVLYSLLLMVVLDTVGINITALIAGLGVGSVAVALAVQGILSDLFASLSIIFDKPFEVGDFIVVDDMSGTVQHIGLRTTRIRSLSGEQLVFANNDLLESRIRNYKRMAERRVAFNIQVEYGTPAEKLERVPRMIEEIITGLGDTRFDRSHLSSLGASFLEFETVYYVLSSDYNLYMDIQQKLNLELYRQFEEQQIAFGFPRQTVLVRREGERPAEQLGVEREG